MRIYAKMVDADFMHPNGVPMIATVHTIDTIPGQTEIEIHKHSVGSLSQSYRQQDVIYYDNQTESSSTKININKLMKDRGWFQIGGYYSISCGKNVQELFVVSHLMASIALSGMIEDEPDYYKPCIQNSCKTFKRLLGDPKMTSVYWDVGIRTSLTIICHALKLSNLTETLAKEENTMKETNVIIGVVALLNPATPTKIVVNKNDRCVVVFFTDGQKEVVKCSADDEFDPYVGVALAKARHEYGSTGAFHRAVDGLALVVEKPAKKTKKPVEQTKKTTAKVIKKAKK